MEQKYKRIIGVVEATGILTEEELIQFSAKLNQMATSQEIVSTAKVKADFGLSNQMLHYHINHGNLEKVQLGIRKIGITQESYEKFKQDIAIPKGVVAHV